MDAPTPLRPTRIPVTVRRSSCACPVLTRIDRLWPHANSGAMVVSVRRPCYKLSYALGRLRHSHAGRRRCRHGLRRHRWRRDAPQRRPGGRAPDQDGVLSSRASGCHGMRRLCAHHRATRSPPGHRRTRLSERHDRRVWRLRRFDPHDRRDGAIETRAPANRARSDPQGAANRRAGGGHGRNGHPYHQVRPAGTRSRPNPPSPRRVPPSGRQRETRPLLARHPIGRAGHGHRSFPAGPM